MKKIAIALMVIMLTALASFATAGEDGHGKAGRLFLFQKCNDSLKGVQGYDPSFGCPTGPGPWPVFFGKDRFGKMDYSLWGQNFKFSFEGKNLLSKKNYTLIYYPDPWPGNKLICLGSGNTNKKGNLEIHGSKDIGTSLPALYDANYNPVPTVPPSSGAVGAKIWLVQSEDVQCSNGTSAMLNWNPTAYLFEYNLIVYERREKDIDEELEDD
jgi:hypothetical protein